MMPGSHPTHAAPVHKTKHDSSKWGTEAPEGGNAYWISRQAPHADGITIAAFANDRWTLLGNPTTRTTEEMIKRGYVWLGEPIKAPAELGEPATKHA